MAQNITIILDGVTLPTPDVPFKEIIAGNEADVITLDATTYTDWINTKRSWSLVWGQLSKTDYDIIRAIRDDQYTNEAYPMLEIDYYNILAPVKVTINDKDIRMDGLCIRDVELTLIEQYAVS